MVHSGEVLWWAQKRSSFVQIEGCVWDAENAFFARFLWWDVEGLYWALVVESIVCTVEEVFSSAEMILFITGGI